jgi:hypothetical protein
MNYVLAGCAAAGGIFCYYRYKNHAANNENSSTEEKNEFVNVTVKQHNCSGNECNVCNEELEQFIVGGQSNNKNENNQEESQLEPQSEPAQPEENIQTNVEQNGLTKITEPIKTVGELEQCEQQEQDMSPNNASTDTKPNAESE